MKSINWSEILSFLLPITLSAGIGALVTALMKVLKIIKAKDEKFSGGFFFQLLFEALTCTLFGILLGALASNFTEQIVSIMAASSMGGMFGEKIYQKLSTKIDKTNSITDLDPTNINDDEEEPEKKKEGAIW